MPIAWLLPLAAVAVAYYLGRRDKENDPDKAKAKAEADMKQTQKEEDEKDTAKIVEEQRKEEARRGSKIVNIPPQSDGKDYAKKYAEWKKATAAQNEAPAAQPESQPSQFAQAEKKPEQKTGNDLDAIVKRSFDSKI